MAPLRFPLVLLCLLCLPAWGQVASTSPSQSARVALSEEAQDARRAQDWGLRVEEWVRYRELMLGPLGSYSPNLDPLSALGIEARTEAERRRYAELQVQAESRRVEKLLSYQRAYDAAWQRLQPDMPRVNLPDAEPSPGGPTGSRRSAVFVRDDCPPCDRLVRQLQGAGRTFDLYLVGSDADDARIRAYAQRSGIQGDKVRDRVITLNHDSGRWEALGLGGELPATVRQVNGQWRRQLF